MNKKKLLKRSGIMTSLFAVSFGVAFISQYRENQQIDLGDEEVTETLPTKPLTNQQKLLSNLISLKAFNVNAEVEAVTAKSNRVGISFSGEGDVSDLTNIKLEGSGKANLDGNKIPLELTYYDSTAYFSYRDSRFRIDTDSVFEFVEKLPTVYGIDLEVPAEIKDLDFSSLQDKINAMEDKTVTESGDLCFKLALSEDVDLFIKTDENNNFKGIRTNHFYYNATLFYMDIDLASVDSVAITQPEYVNYQDFKPVFTIFDGIYNLTKEKKNTINVNLDLKKDYQETTTNELNETVVLNTEVKDLLGLDVDLTYDFDNSLYSLDGKVLANEKEAPFNFALYEKRIYARYSDLKVSIQLDSVTALIDYVLAKIGEAKIEETIDTMMEKMKDVPIMDYINDADKMLGTITLTESNMGLDITPSEAGIDGVSSFSVDLSFDAEGLKSLAVTDLKIKDYYASLVLTFGEYKPFNLIHDDYAEVDPVLGLVDVYENYATMTEQKFQIAFDGKVENNDTAIKPINIDGNVQFEVDPERSEETNIGYGYGYVNVVDRDEYRHNIKADMKSVDEILFSYNDTMNGKAKIRTMKELTNMVMDLVKNPDKHFEELFGEIIEKVNNMPIKQVIDGDYTQLLTTNIIDRFVTGENDGVYYLEADIALDIINFSEYGFTVRLEWENKETEDGTPNPVLDALKISNCQIGEENITFNIYLHDYNQALESTRLDSYQEYIDFSDIKVLLELGINTSKFNYYHFTANATLTIAIFGGIDFDIPIDVKLHSKDGDIKLALELTKVPLIALANKSLATSTYGAETSRKASIYYHDKTFFINRVDISEKGLFFKTKYQTTVSRRCDVDYMLENALTVLLQDALGLNDTAMNLITKSTEKSEGHQIRYEKILKNFIYNANSHYFFFDIDLAEIANNDQLTNFTLKVKTDNSNTELRGLDVHLGISVLVTLNLDISLDLADRNEVADDTNKITALESYIVSHANDTLNQRYSNTVRV